MRLRTIRASAAHARRLSRRSREEGAELADGGGETRRRRSSTHGPSVIDHGMLSSAVGPDPCWSRFLSRRADSRSKAQVWKWLGYCPIQSDPARRTRGGGESNSSGSSNSDSRQALQPSQGCYSEVLKANTSIARQADLVAEMGRGRRRELHTGRSRRTGPSRPCALAMRRLLASALLNGGVLRPHRFAQGASSGPGQSKTWTGAVVNSKKTCHASE